MFMVVFLFVMVLVALVLFVVITSGFIGFLLTRVPYVRSPREDMARLFEAAGLRAGQVFYELGSGDGRVVFLAEEYARVKATGFELMYWTHWIALARKKFRKSSATLLRQNFLKHSWADVDVLYCYLFPHLMPKVEQKFLAECKPGAVLISRDFKLPNLRPEQVIEFTSMHNAYIYRR